MTCSVQAWYNPDLFISDNSGMKRITAKAKQIRLVIFDVDGVITDEQNRTAELTPPGGPITSIVSFGENGAGELFIVSRDGDIHRIVPEPVLGMTPLMSKLRSPRRGIRRYWVPATLTGVVLLTAAFFVARTTVLRHAIMENPIQLVDPGDVASP